MQVRGESIYRATDRVTHGETESFLLPSCRPSPAWKLLYVSVVCVCVCVGGCIYLNLHFRTDIPHLPLHLNSALAVLSHAVDYLRNNIGSGTSLVVQWIWESTSHNFVPSTQTLPSSLTPLQLAFVSLTALRSIHMEHLALNLSVPPTKAPSSPATGLSPYRQGCPWLKVSSFSHLSQCFDLNSLFQSHPLHPTHPKFPHWIYHLPPNILTPSVTSCLCKSPCFHPEYLLFPHSLPENSYSVFKAGFPHHRLQAFWDSS